MNFAQNPAFVALLIQRMSLGYEQACGRGLPISLVYLGIPMLLHAPSRKTLPTHTRTDLAGWLQANPQIHVGLRTQLQELRPICAQALNLGLGVGLLELEAHGLLAGPEPKRPATHQWHLDTAECLTAARTLGAWQARSGLAEYQLSVWGVTL